MGSTESLNLDGILRWAVFRQMKIEGGFQGKTNKLVDSCYSVWVGAIPELYRQVKFRETGDRKILETKLVDTKAVVRYVLQVCGKYALFSDRPRNSPDFYHTCYALSGLSLLQDELDDETRLRPTCPFYNVTQDRVKEWRSIDNSFEGLGVKHFYEVMNY